MNSHQDASTNLSDFLSLRERLKQVRAGLEEALGATANLTQYPHQEAAVPTLSPEQSDSLISTVDQMIAMEWELNMRLARVNEVVGGRI